MTAQGKDADVAPCFIEKLSVSLVLVTGIVAALVTPFPFFFGLLAGGLIATANFYVMRQSLAALIRARRNPARVFLSLLLMSKFFIVLGILYLVVTHLSANPLGVISGVSLFVMSVFAEAIRGMLTAPQEVEAE